MNETNVMSNYVGQLQKYPGMNKIMGYADIYFIQTFCFSGSRIFEKKRKGRVPVIPWIYHMAMG
jgi:hypothetical protein